MGSPTYTDRMTRCWVALLTAPMLAMLLTPRPAEACGGTFCDLGPQAMPVDQTGENILFVLGEGYTEAHIQIQYDPNTAAKFAWVVPMLALPEFSIGCDRLFDNTLAATVPTYGFSYQFDDCGGNGSNSGTAGASAGDTSADDGSTGGDPGPEVVLQQTVGAFDITVLQGGTAAEVMQWLADNEYEQDPDAEPILAEYLAENYMFAAFKLTNGADLAEIHPIVLRFENDEACVPLRLTRIAAVDDMEVRTFFLAESRVVPQNYKHVLVNPLRLDWPGLAANYKSIITQAVDAFGADGKAFVTEYAGPSSVVNTFGIFGDLWNAQAFSGLPAVDVIDTLSAQGLVSCYDGGFETTGGSGTECAFDHPLLRGLLNTYLPVPDGLDEIEFYGCLTCFEAEIDLDAWGDGSAFATAMQERIIDPGAHASDLLATFPTLTRMYTTISPAEMTADPFFWANPDLPDVDLTNAIATRRVLCNGDAVWTLPDGREVYVPGDGPWPDFSDEMPYEEEVAETPRMGPPIVMVDNREIIATELRTHNCQYGWPGDGTCGAGSGGSDSSGSDGSSAGADEGGGGCGCTSGGNAGWGALAMVVGVGLARRRRRG